MAQELTTELSCPPYDPYGIAPLTLTHIALVLALVVLISERAQIRRALVLFSTWAVIYAWYAYRRLSRWRRGRAQPKRANADHIVVG
jgi:hypothetical protein